MAQEGLDAVGDEESLVFAVGSLVVADQRTALAVGPQLLAFALDIVGDHRASGLQNHLSGAVVLLQPDDAGVGKVFLKFKNVADVGAAPGINALVLVAHRADVLSLAGEQLHQLVLGAVGVLVLIDQQIAVAALVALAGFRGDFEQANGLQQQVVEVEGVAFEQLGLVALEDVGDAFAVGIPGAEVILLRIDHVALGP